MIKNYLSIFGKASIQIFISGILVGLCIGFMVMFSHNDKYNLHHYSSSPDASIPFYDFVSEHSMKDTHHKMMNTSLADHMFHKIKVLCWVMTGPANHLKKAIHVKATWGKRCNKLLFMSTDADPILPTIALPVIENRINLWGKTKEALKYVYSHYHDQYDWFFKADDDTYTVMENLRYMLYYKNSSEPIFYGCRMKQESLDYMSGGAGYVLSKEALKRFVENALPYKTICKHENTGDEDVEIGKCLQNVGVKLGYSQDDETRNRFTPVYVNDMLIPGVMSNVKWYTEMMYNPYKLGFRCCSDNLITTHYVEPNQMYLLEYLIYHVTAFGRAYQPVLGPSYKSKPDNDIGRLPTEKELQWDAINS